MRARTTTTDAVGRAVRHLCRLAGATAADGAADRHLLERYAAAGDVNAFTALVKRHGPMVLGVCRRVLHHEQDAEDAFQGTFLILARKARSIRKLDSVSSWLYGVAYRLAARARAQAAGRRRRETRGADMRGGDLTADITWRELRGALDEELARLPDDCRGPLLLCYLEGKTQDEAARDLVLTKAQVRRRLDRGLSLLRGRLGRRGLTFSAGLFALALAQGASAPAAVPGALVATTVTAAGLFGAGRAAAGAVSARAVALAEGGLKAMFLSKVKTITTLVLLFGLVAAGAGALTHQALAARPGEADDPAQAAKATAPVPVQVKLVPLEVLAAGAAGQEQAVRDPDALPAGALARLGSTRLYRGNGFYHLGFSPDNKVLACARIDGTVRLVEVATGKEVGRLGTPQTYDAAAMGRRDYWVSGIAFAPDGKLIAVHKPKDGVIVFDRAKGEEVCRFAVDLQYEASSLAFSPDTVLCAISSHSNAENRRENEGSEQ